jgi:hypothetical protein
MRGLSILSFMVVVFDPKTPGKINIIHAANHLRC